MEYIVPVVLALITSVVGPIAVEWAKQKVKKVDRDPLAEAIEHNQIIDQQLEAVMEELNCSRVWIAQFHNGGHFYPTGKSIQKFSIFYEKVLPGVDSIMETFQNIPVSLFPTALSKLYRDKDLAVLNCEEDEKYDLPPVPGEKGSHSFYMVSIYDTNDRFIGIFAMSFAKQERRLTKEEWIFIRNKIGVVGTILSEYLTVTKK